MISQFVSKVSLLYENYRLIEMKKGDNFDVNLGFSY